MTHGRNQERPTARLTSVDLHALADGLDELALSLNRVLSLLDEQHETEHWNRVYVAYCHIVSTAAQLKAGAAAIDADRKRRQRVRELRQRRAETTS